MLGLADLYRVTPMIWLAVAVGAVLLGSLVYTVLSIVATASYLRSARPRASSPRPPISILTPLAGLDLGLEDNLRSSFEQDYPDFEIVLAVRHETDPAVPVARKLIGAYPSVPARLIVTGDPDCPNAKVFALTAMTAAARHDLLVMNDSDIRIQRDMLQRVAAEFANPRLGLATCLYRAIPGGGWPSRLEALGMNTHFLAGVLVARMLEGVKFALGPSLVVRRVALETVGGWKSLNTYLAEDYVLGNRVFEAGFEVILSSVRVEHRIGSADVAECLLHRLRWARSTRRSRPKGYAGSLFTFPIPIALLLVAILPAAWPALVLTLVLRYIAAWATAGAVLHDRDALRFWWAIPIEDVLAFAVWLAGFFGNRVKWRGRTYIVHADGRFEPVAAPR
jgi:ceramide glucosyltransferase